MQKNICRTVISSEEQNLIIFHTFSMLNFHTFSMLYMHFDQIQYFFKVFKTDFTIQNFFSTVWDLCLTLEVTQPVIFR